MVAIGAPLSAGCTAGQVPGAVTQLRTVPGPNVEAASTAKRTSGNDILAAYAWASVTWARVAAAQPVIQQRIDHNP
ncbi:unnamed protein product [Lampetra planeri]